MGGNLISKQKLEVKFMTILQIYHFKYNDEVDILGMQIRKIWNYFNTEYFLFVSNLKPKIYVLHIVDIFLF